MFAGEWDNLAVGQSCEIRVGDQVVWAGIGDNAGLQLTYIDISIS
jgi:hypothetical protein